MRRVLVVCADDLGESAGTNSGIVQAHDKGIVTSASLMVRRPAAIDATTLARERPRLSVGLHLDLGEWALRRGRWEPVYVVVPLDEADAVEAEVGRQFERFRALLGRDPTHLDSHQHVHMAEPVRSVALRAANALGIPLRAIASPAEHCGAFYGQSGNGEPLPEAIKVDALAQLLRTLPEGVTELVCHPGSDAQLASSYRLERLRELEALCDARVSTMLKREGIELSSFADLALGRL